MCRFFILFFLVSLLVVCSWLLIFQTHFKDHFIPNTKDDDLSLLLEKNKKIDDSDDDKCNRNNSNNDNENEEYNSAINGLSFDMDEEIFVGTDGGISQKSNNTELPKKRKHTNPVNGSPSKNNNPFADINNNNIDSNNIEIHEIRRDLGIEKSKVQVQMSEGSSILKIEQIELLASWLPSKITIIISHFC